MSTTRLEAFSDAVIAIIMTIMVLELKVPHGAQLSDLGQVWPTLLFYLLSFAYLGIYWNNHHHLLHVAGRISGSVLWANMHLLFWLSLIPFATAWMGENQFAPVPTAAYGAVLIACAVAYSILVRVLIRAQPSGSTLEQAIGGDRKGYVSLLLYASAIPLAFVHQGISHALYVLVALIWIVPDSRIESRVS